MGVMPACARCKRIVSAPALADAYVTFRVMVTAPEGAAGAPRAGVALLAGAAAVVGGALFFGGGSGAGSLVWVGGGAVLLAAAAALAGVPLPSPGRAGTALLGLLAALVAWTGASVSWSVAPDRSWDSTNRGLAYLAFLALGLAVGSLGPRALRTAAAGLALLTGLALVWALAGKAVPALFPDGARAARLRSPVGYWNGLALVADVAVPLGLWAATRGRRTAGALLVYAATVGVLLTSSRTGVGVAVLAALAWVGLARERVRGAVVALLAAAPGAAVAGWAFTRPALVDDGQPLDARRGDGLRLALLLLAGAALVAALVRATDRPLPARFGRVLAVSAAVAAAVALVGFVVAVGNPVAWAGEQFTRGEAVNTPGRLASLSSNNRWQWWNEAWDVFLRDPAAGAGAGAFEVARRRVRPNAVSVTEPHSVPLQLLADLGVVGFALGLGAAAAALAVARSALARLDGGERAAAAALALAPAIWLAHGLVDYPWDFLAVTAPVLVATGALASAGRVRGLSPAVPGGVRGAVVAAALAVLASLAAPALADRSVRDATLALDRGDLSAADAAVDRARALDPFALEPLYIRAAVALRRGDERGALRAYADATSVQPDNPESWYARGVFELSLGGACLAYQHLNRAYTLDPNGAEWRRGGPLDRARAAVNAGACEPR